MHDSLTLRPLSIDDAEVMETVLADPALYVFIGGEPPSAEELRRRYAIQTRGHSADHTEKWVNEIVLLDQRPVGYVQATITADDQTAEIAWVIGAPWQRRGFAGRAAALLVHDLAARGTHRLIAHIHPDNAASQRIATRLGMSPTDVVVDDEVRWVVDADPAVSRA